MAQPGHCCLVGRDTSPSHGPDPWCPRPWAASWFPPARRSSRVLMPAHIAGCLLGLKPPLGRLRHTCVIYHSPLVPVLYRFKENRKSLPPFRFCRCAAHVLNVTAVHAGNHFRCPGVCSLHRLLCSPSYSSLTPDTPGVSLIICSLPLPCV